jgi:hypothetical protein
MSRYACFCYLHVIEKDAEADFERYVELPFPPYPGLILVFNDVESDFLEISRAEYIVGGDVFHLDGHRRFDDLGEYACPCGPESGCDCSVLDLNYYAALGWELSGEVRRGADRMQKVPGMFPDPEPDAIRGPA